MPNRKKVPTGFFAGMVFLAVVNLSAVSAQAQIWNRERLGSDLGEDFPPEPEPTPPAATDCTANPSAPGCKKPEAKPTAPAQTATPTTPAPPPACIAQTQQEAQRCTAAESAAAKSCDGNSGALSGLNTQGQQLGSSLSSQANVYNVNAQTGSYQSDVSAATAEFAASCGPAATSCNTACTPSPTASSCQAAASSLQQMTSARNTCVEYQQRAQQAAQQTESNQQTANQALDNQNASSAAATLGDQGPLSQTGEFQAPTSGAPSIANVGTDSLDAQASPAVSGENEDSLQSAAQNNSNSFGRESGSDLSTKLNGGMIGGWVGGAFGQSTPNAETPPEARRRALAALPQASISGGSGGGGRRRLAFARRSPRDGLAAFSAESPTRGPSSAEEDVDLRRFLPGQISGASSSRRSDIHGPEMDIFGKMKERYQFLEATFYGAEAPPADRLPSLGVPD